MATTQNTKNEATHFNHYTRLYYKVSTFWQVWIGEWMPTTLSNAEIAEHVANGDMRPEELK